MRILLCILILFFCGVSSADDLASEVAKLKNRVATLEAENETLRERLARIAALSSAPLHAVPSETLSISLASDDWGGAAQPDILKVLDSAVTPLWISAGKPPLHPISVTKNSEGPLVAFKRGPADSYKVLLNVEGRLWAKFSYQFSHEMCHILCNYRNVPNKQVWFQESLCESASLYSLRAMGRSWKTTPPYENWKSYADALTDYATNRIQEAEDVPPADLAVWYVRNQPTLDKSGTNRDLNLIVAIKLLEIFEKYPESWHVVRSLNLGDPAENETLKTYLTGWHNRVADSEKHIVKEIAKLFGVKLGK